MVQKSLTRMPSPIPFLLTESCAAWRRRLLIAFLMISVGRCVVAGATEAGRGAAGAGAVEISDSEGGLTVRVDTVTGAYEVVESEPGWTFGGSMGAPLKSGTVRRGLDDIGAYSEIAFEGQGNASPMAGAIRLYQNTPAILFTGTTLESSEKPPAPFPDFNLLPRGLHQFSYRPECFAPPAFRCVEGATPWLLFDDNLNAVIVSPASHFFPASMLGDGGSRIGVGFNRRLRNCPAGFIQEALVVFGQGINAAWNMWGATLTALRSVKRPAETADVTLKYLGYWTDNGCEYYYRFDPAKGYGGTLKAAIDYYRNQKVPIGYLQLDSWWYPKTFTGPNGAEGGPKNPELPAGDWNRYGGMLEYVAQKDVFPAGLEAFHREVKLPLAVHNRWVDPASPYRQQYRFSGLAPVDPKFWDAIAAFLQSSGVAVYEQDWLDVIFFSSPEFLSTVNAGESFTDSMAQGCRAHKLTMQYCMPLPCHFLQGAGYENLTSVRVSQDGFQRARWRDALFTSRLAAALRIRPWTDVARGGDPASFLLSNLSAGPLGIGEATGRENKAGILKAIRTDGVIVKPDAPIVPLDESYLTEARMAGGPLMASTYTEHGDRRTVYVFAFNPENGSSGGEVRFDPGELGAEGPVYVYDGFTGTAKRLAAGSVFSGTLNAQGVGFFIVARLGKSGIAFLGDAGKYISTGKQRIASIRGDSGKITVGVTFALDEPSVTLHGYAAAAPKTRVRTGSAGPVRYDPATQHFTVEIKPDPAAPVMDSMGDPTRHATVVLEMR